MALPQMFRQTNAARTSPRDSCWRFSSVSRKTRCQIRVRNRIVPQENTGKATLAGTLVRDHRRNSEEK